MIPNGCTTTYKSALLEGLANPAPNGAASRLTGMVGLPILQIWTQHGERWSTLGWHAWRVRSKA